MLPGCYKFNLIPSVFPLPGSWSEAEGDRRRRKRDPGNRVAINFMVVTRMDSPTLGETLIFVYIPTNLSKVLPKVSKFNNGVTRTIHVDLISA